MDLMKWKRAAPLDLWDAFTGIQGDLDRVLSAFKVPDAAGIFDWTAAPAVDVIETPEEYQILADLPGVDKKDLEVTLTGTLLSIKGSRKEESESRTRKQYRKETSAGKFRRTLDLPSQVDASKVEAEFKDGVLSLRIAKREEAKTKLITVSVQ